MRRTRNPVPVTESGTDTDSVPDMGTVTGTATVTVLPTTWGVTGAGVTLPGGLEAGGSGGRRDPESPVYPRPWPRPCP